MAAHVDPARCIQLNERRQAQAMADLADEHERVGTGVMAFSAGTHWICKAVGVGLDGPLPDEDASRIARWFRKRDVPPVVEVSDAAGEPTFAALARAGFHLTETEHVLSRIPAEIDIAPPPGVTIERLDPEDPEAMRRHAEIVCSGFPPPDGHVPHALLESAMRSQRHPNAWGFFARLEDGTPVAASGMEITSIESVRGEAPAKVLALWGTTVLEAHRRRGIQQALIAHRLGVGFRHGCELALIESKPGIPTERNATRLGFARTYTRLGFRASA